MALNIKNSEVEQLATEVSAITGESNTEAVRQALRERKVRLAFRITSVSQKKRLSHYLEQELWPVIPLEQLGRRLSREEEEAILGFKEGGF